jgi:UDP-glucose 4-epimerase
MKVLITGITGALARMVALRLLEGGHQVLGLDKNPWPDAPRRVQMFRADISKRPAEDVFRNHQPDAVIHMATVTHFSANTHERYRVNLGGTQRVFDFCQRYGVQHALFISRHTVYGAASDIPLYHTEDDPPLAAATFPRLADLVAADMFAGSALWRYPNLRTCVLRMVYTLGPSKRGTLASYLRGPRVPTLLGFDPLFQMMHEQDAAQAIVTAVEHASMKGIFNVAGPSPVPLSLVCQVAGRQRWPLPEPLFKLSLGRLGFSWLPEDAVSHIKHPIVIDDHAFRAASGFSHTFDEIETLESYRWAS